MLNLQRLKLLADAGRILIWRDDSFDKFDDATGKVFFQRCNPNGDLLVSPFGGELTDEQAKSFNL